MIAPYCGENVDAFLGKAENIRFLGITWILTPEIPLKVSKLKTSRNYAIRATLIRQHNSYIRQTMVR